MSYQDFLKQVRVSEFKSDSVLKATSLYNAFYQTQITVLDVEIDSSKCTNFGYFFAFKPLGVGQGLGSEWYHKNLFKKFSAKFSNRDFFIPNVF